MKKISLFFVALCLIFPLACDKMDTELVNVEVLENELTLETAKKWFEENELSKSNLRNSVNGEDETVEINWELASKQKVNKLAEEAVIVPIIKRKKGDISTLKHLWIYNDKQKNKTSRVFEYIYDTKLPKNRMQSLKKFTGIMLMREWNGKFLGGLKISENKIEGAVSEINYNGKKEKFETPKSPNGRSSACVSWTVCQNWTITFGTVAVHGTGCYTDFYCYWTSTNGIDPAFTGVLIDIPTIPSAVYSSIAGTNGDWPTSPPTSTNFGFAPSLCEGLNIMLQAQTAQGKEIAGAITTEGKVIMFPTQGNTESTMDITFPYTSPDGQIKMSLVHGNPDPADPNNDGKYQDDDTGIEIADYARGRAFYYKIAGLVHSHPIGPGYKPDVPSDKDKLVARTWPSKMKHYIINNNNLVEYNASRIINTRYKPCN